MALLRDAKANQFDIVVVHTIDRWSRNVGVQRQALQMLGDADVGFAFLAAFLDLTHWLAIPIVLVSMNDYLAESVR